MEYANITERDKIPKAIRADFINKINREPETKPFANADYNIIMGENVRVLVFNPSYIPPTESELATLLEQDFTLSSMQLECVNDFKDTPASLVLTIYAIMKKMNDIIASINGGPQAIPWQDVSTLAGAIQSLDSPIKALLSDPAIRDKLNIKL